MKAVSFQMISLQRDKEASSGWELPVFHPLFAREQTITAVSWSAWQLTICQRVVAALRETIIVENILAIFLQEKSGVDIGNIFVYLAK